MTSIGLRWTGHPLIDMGVASIVIATENDTPEEVSVEQWQSLMMQLKKDYFLGVYKKTSYAIHHNLFEEPSRAGSTPKSIQARQDFIHDFFEQWVVSPKKSVGTCTFFSEQPAVLRSARDKVPMLLGKGQLNFYPHGESEVPISSLALGCILALPLCTPPISGRLPILSIDDKELLLNVCYSWYEELKAEFAMVRLKKGELNDRKAPRTRLWKILQEVFDPNSKHRTSQTLTPEPVLASITMYHLSNIGTGPGIDIYTILPHVLVFAQKAKSNLHHKTWEALVNSFWRNSTGKITGKAPASEKIQVLKNALYESLDQLPDNTLSFIRYFFLQFVQNRVGLRNEIQVINIDIWSLITLFLKEVVNMSPTRIQKIQSLADALALEVMENNDKSVFRGVLGTSGGDAYGAFRNLMVRTLRKRLERKDSLLFTTGDYLEIFEVGEELVVSDWKMARDLIRIRFLESLYNADFFKKEGKELLFDVIDTESD